MIFLNLVPLVPFCGYSFIDTWTLKATPLL